MTSYNRDLSQTLDGVVDEYQNQQKIIQRIQTRLQNIKQQSDISSLDKIQKKYQIRSRLNHQDYSKHPFDSIVLESSDSESLVVSEVMEFPPTIKEVQETILSELDYPQIPLGIIINQRPPISTLIVQNVPIFFQVSLFKEFTNSLPIKGFIQQIRTIYYNSKPSIALILKTNQPHMVASQFSQKHHSKSLKLLLGNDYKMFQINPHPCKNMFFGVIFRGLMMHLCVQEIVQLLKIQQPDVTIESYNSEILEVKGVGCLMMNLASLQDCSKVCRSLNHTNLYGLQEKEIHVTLNPRCLKKDGLCSLASTPIYWKRKESVYRHSIQKNQHCTMRAREKKMMLPAVIQYGTQIQSFTRPIGEQTIFLQEFAHNKESTILSGTTFLQSLNIEQDQIQINHHLESDMNNPIQYNQVVGQAAYYLPQPQMQNFIPVNFLPLPPPPRAKLQQNIEAVNQQQLIALRTPPPPPPPPPPPTDSK